MKIITTFKNESDAPILGLSPLLNIVDISDINTPISSISSGSLTEIGSGFYGYEFASYTQGSEYSVFIDADSDIENKYQYGTLDKIDSADFLNTLDTDIENSVGIKEMMRIMFAVLANKSGGGNTSTITFRDNDDSKDRITATVDSDGNRLAVVLDTI